MVKAVKAVRIPLLVVCTIAVLGLVRALLFEVDKDI